MDRVPFGYTGPNNSASPGHADSGFSQWISNFGSSVADLFDDGGNALGHALQGIINFFSGH